ncbi:MAG: 50S ribosomal protein L3 N(5)-glutamine methyltransferase [Betaproteobacteria bacterium]|nr:50S ribosomal protein L3 N(5)-glutamine methyltransferase [Betaproteobacteria bacterium]
MNTSDINTVDDFITYAENRCLDADLHFGHGSATAFDEVVYLTLHTLGLPLDELESVLPRQLSASEREALVAVIERRVQSRLPAAYLTREAWLGPYRFYIDERALVPRSFIAELLLEDLSPWVADPVAVGSVLDLCTGSGCLAIVAALTFPNALVEGADISADALAVAQRNVADYDLAARVKLTASDMFQALGGRRYDLIITNPPYVTAVSMAALPEEYRHEPALALASGEDGLVHVRTILREAAHFLNEGGLLVVEVGFNREGVEAAFPRIPFIWLEVSAGDEVVFLLDKETLLTHCHDC